MPLGELFKFSKSERRALLILIILLFIVLLTRWGLSHITPDRSEEQELFKQEVERFKSELQQDRQLGWKGSNNYSLDYFNPNFATDSVFQSLGLNKGQIRNIRNYLKTGARFNSADDFAKIYSISDSLFLALKPFILIPESKVEIVDFGESTISEKKQKLFVFDPNSVSKSSLLALGFSELSQKALLNYRKKGGHFYVPEDLLKIYGIDSSLFSQIKDFVRIDSLITKSENSAQKHVGNKKEKLRIELNSALKDELVSLPGIGPVFADRILRYRNLLGGYSAINQLLEVYGMDSVRYSGIISFLELDESLVILHKVNFESENQLASHPYINYAFAEKIVKSRNRKGSFKSMNDFQERTHCPDSLLQKLTPYLFIN